MPSKSNQEIEHWYFELFSRSYQLPKGVVSYGDKPDVIIEGERKIGMEVTTFYPQSGEHRESEQRQIKLREDILDKAQQRYLEKGGKYLWLVFDFNKEHPIQNKEKFITRIVDLVQKIEDYPTGEIIKDNFIDIPEIRFLSINQEFNNDHTWVLLYSGSVPMMSTSRLVQIVREKEHKLKQYRKCDAYWLLVVIDFVNPAMDQEIKIDSKKIKSDIFENVILYKTGFETIVEFKK